MKKHTIPEAAPDMALPLFQPPEDLHSLDDAQLIALADDLRAYIIESMNVCGGHFAANLGTIELTLALYSVFNPIHDKIIWDVGHQAYAHKILTGRADAITTIRRSGGLTPFPTQGEHPADCFGTGHSSTSISAALGMAIGAHLSQTPKHAVAVIGDGAMTAGLAFEALNHGGHLEEDLLVVLNDNEMSISKNVGALSNYFARMLTGKVYTSMREGSKKILSVVPPVKALAKRTEVHMKGMLAPGTLFEELGFNYYGPVDGHNIAALRATLNNLSTHKGPRLLHVVTQKGKGYAPAEADPIKYHAVKPGFLNSTDQAAANPAPKKLTYSNVFGQWLCDQAKADARLVGITPAMREGSDLIAFSEAYPERYFDVGIAEQHSVTLAAGLACEGQKPVVAIYSTFLQRAYDQLIHDVALQNLPVLFAVDRAGIVGGDGATHQGQFDLSYARAIPNLCIMTPADEAECYRMLSTGFELDGPALVRYPRGVGPGVALPQDLTAIPLGKAQILRQGKRVAVLAFGSMVPVAKTVGEAIDATVVNMRFVKPLDDVCIQALAASHDVLVTLEENAVQGGAGSAVLESLQRAGILCHTMCIGLPDRFIEHGDPQTVLAQAGLDATSIQNAIETKLAECVQSD